MYFPRLDGCCFQLFLTEFQKAFPGDDITIVLDNAKAHFSDESKNIDRIKMLPLPAYSPELNPAERLFKELKGKMADKLFDNIEQLEEILTEKLAIYWKNKNKLQQLTAFPWWIEAIDDINDIIDNKQRF